MSAHLHVATLVKLWVRVHTCLPCLSQSDGILRNCIVSGKYKPISQVNKRSVAPRLQCSAHSTSLSERRMLDHYHTWSGHCLQLDCCRKPTLVVGGDQFVFFGAWGVVKLAPGNLPILRLTHQQGPRRRPWDRQRSSSPASDLTRCGVKPCQIVVLCFNASSFQNSCMHHVGIQALHSQRHRHVGLTLANNPSESMSVFEMTLLDQTRQESLFRYLREKTDAAWKQNTVQMQANHLRRHIKDALQ